MTKMSIKKLILTHIEDNPIQIVRALKTVWVLSD